MKTSNTQRLCAGPQVVQQTPTKFWNIASVGEVFAGLISG